MAEIVGFAVCWLVVAGLMLWGVFTEHRRGGRASITAFDRHPSGSGKASGLDWVVIETAQGSTPDVVEQARFMAAAWLAARGVDVEVIPPADLRTEVTTTDDGSASTRILVRSRALHTSRRRR